MPVLNAASQNSQADNLGTDYATATVTIYDSGNTALAAHTLTGWGAAAAGVITANGLPDTTTILATGTADHAKLEAGAYEMQVTAGLGADIPTPELILTSLSYVAGEESTMNSLTLTQPAS